MVVAGYGFHYLISARFDSFELLRILVQSIDIYLISNRRTVTIISMYICILFLFFLHVALQKLHFNQRFNSPFRLLI